MKITLAVSQIIETIMAADGLSASLDRSEQRLTVINDGHTPALEQLITQALAIVMTDLGDAVSECNIDSDNITVTHADNICIEAQLRTAIVWRTLQLAYAGTDRSRAKQCASLAAAALATYTAPCPPHRSPSW